MKIRTVLSLKDELELRLHDNEKSTDVCMMQRRFTHVPLFVYGSEQRGYSDQHLLLKATRVGTGKTLLPHYKMYVTDDSPRIPVVFHRPMDAGSACIRGELYVIPTARLWQFDHLFANGQQHIRRWTKIAYKKVRMIGSTEQPQGFFQTEALMYCANQFAAYWRNRKDAQELIPLSTFTDNDLKVDYYVFTMLHDRENRKDAEWVM